MIDNQASQIEQVELDTLIPYARNARTHSPEQVAQIAASMREFGFNNPVLIDEKNGIVAGHGRVLAAQKIGLATVPCIRLDWLSDAQRRAYILADNQIADNSEWDQALLDAELAELDISREIMGFAALAEDGAPDIETNPAVETGPVRDVFWINIVGPLKNQAMVLDRLRAAMSDIEPVTVELGTVNRG
jgi:hypothetical protein